MMTGVTLYVDRALVEEITAGTVLLDTSLSMMAKIQQPWPLAKEELVEEEAGNDKSWQGF
jgi:hypothetical protein